MSSDESDLTPESIKLDALGIVNNLLPEKSKEKYLKAYDDFHKWKTAKGAKSVSESVLLVYFEYLSCTKKSSSLWTIVNAPAAEDPQQLKSWQEIPGPSSLPVIGQLHHILLPGGILRDLNTFPEEMFKRFGPIVKLDGMFGRPTMIILYDPESCATILRGENWMPRRPGFQSLEYYRKYYNKTIEQSLKPCSLITDQGENWKQVRSTTSPVLLQPQTIKLYSNVLDEVAQEMIARMKSIRDEKNMLKGKFDVEMNLWALESIGAVALGGRLNCFDPNLPEDSPARKLIQCVHDLFEITLELDFKPSLWKIFATPTFKRAMKLYEEQENLAKYFVNKAIKELQTKPKSDDGKGVLAKLLEIHEEVAVNMASDMLFAGIDTAANTMTATLYLLAVNPEKQKKLREELISVQAQRPYLKACIKESLRCMPVASANVRQLNKDYSILGYKLPKDMQVVFSHQLMSLMESQFPKPREYIPERWIEKDSPLSHTNAHPFAYSPFGFGVRGCIGRRIAELEIETFLARIIQNFQVEWFGPPLKVNAMSLNYCVEPFNFVFKDVKTV